jgi:hypothetical protein
VAALAPELEQSTTRLPTPLRPRHNQFPVPGQIFSGTLKKHSREAKDPLAYQIGETPADQELCSGSTVVSEGSSFSAFSGQLFRPEENDGYSQDYKQMRGLQQTLDHIYRPLELTSNVELSFRMGRRSPEHAPKPAVSWAILTMPAVKIRRMVSVRDALPAMHPGINLAPQANQPMQHC